MIDLTAGDQRCQIGRLQVDWAKGEVVGQARRLDRFHFSRGLGYPIGVESFGRFSIGKRTVIGLADPLHGNDAGGIDCRDGTVKLTT
jgi:hypothetical protein